MSNIDKKPFDLSLAQQGHPLITRAGQSAKFIAYVPEANENQQLIIFVDNTIYTRAATGRHHYRNDCASDLFLAPIGYCEGLPVFAGDKLIGPCGDITVGPYMTEHGAFELAKWPSKAPVVETRMSDRELLDIDLIGTSHARNRKDIANKAIERSIADGDVIPTSLFVEMACKVFNKNYGSNASFNENAHIILKDYLEGLK